MPKRTAPALYELIRHGGERPVPARQSDADAHPGAPTTPPGTWLQPGRSIQVPVGYLFLAIALLLGFVVLSYVFGFHRGKESERFVLQEEVGHLAPGDRTQTAHPPLQDPLVQEPTSRPRRPASTDQPRQPPTGAATSPESGSGPIDSDPRRRGMQYLVIAETRPAGALRLADFFRESGLETYVVSSNNPNLRLVIVLPGFESGQTTSPQAAELRQRVRAVGAKWAQDGRGTWRYDEYFRPY